MTTPRPPVVVVVLLIAATVLLASPATATRTDYLVERSLKSASDRVVRIFEVHNGGKAEVHSGVAELANGTTYVLSSQFLGVQYLKTPETLTKAQLPAKVQSSLSVALNQSTFDNVTFERIGNGAYRAMLTQDLPYTKYFGMGTDEVWGCGQEVALSGRQFIQCQQANASNPSFNFTMQISSDGFGIRVNIDHVGALSAFRDSVLSAALHRLSHSVMVVDQAIQTDEDTDARRRENRVAVGFLWAFIALAMAFMILYAGVWHTWWGRFPGLTDMSPERGMYLWVLGYVIIITIASILWGLLGYLAVGIWIFFFDLTSALAYVIVQHQRKQMRESNSRVELVRPAGAVQESGEGAGAKNDDDDDVGDLGPGSTPDFHVKPGKLAHFQSQLIQWYLLLFVLTVAVFWTTFFVWGVNNYYVWNRQTQVRDAEFQPQIVAKGVAMMYVFDRAATRLKLNNVFFDLSTQWCGSNFNEKLNTESERRVIYTDWIDKYDIDMSLYDPSDWRDYDSVNAWFIRSIRPEFRPIADKGNERVMLSPADARVIVFKDVPPDQKIWIKSEEFNIPELLGGEALLGADPNQYGSMAIIRLAPQDYHRYHVPISGTLTKQYALSGTLHSVNADGMTSGNLAIYNQRTVSIIQSTHFGNVAFVAVGATCVGSVKMLAKEGDTVTRGDDFGYFQFGGSTIVLLFQKPGAAGAIAFEDDILQHSQQRVETYMYVNTRLGTVVE
eukprot:TRINITY_DN66504_c4_g6_i1.p1 TRINITY_DN66504_c4_g6~~TRINITY_DN66504_c4_g6_i1.p1  ORF type:complete len:726 (+),score=388.64 TRINITY_DN66504_c4_g6_i1:76-2253(+)